MAKRKFRNPDEWEKIHQNWISSGQSMSEFCAEIGIAPQSLYNYRLRREKSRPVNSPRKSSFVEPGPLAEPHGRLNLPLEIVLNPGDGIELTIRRTS